MQDKTQWYRFFSHGLIHADFMHLGFNMLTLYFFGRAVENYIFSGSEYTILYISALAASSVFDFIKNRNNPRYASLGASGAVSAVVFATIMLDPWFRGICIYGAICIPNILYGVLYIVYCVYMDKKGNDNIGHNAHLWGSVYGFAFTAILKPALLIEFFNQLLHPHF
jgi:membrane associated rhomboid family serine protease